MRNLNAVLGLLIPLAAALPADAQSESEFRNQRHEAFRMITAGYPMEAANELLLTIRSLPPDDPALVDTASGNLQLLIFDINFLMTDPMREQFFTKTLNTEKSEIDSFIVTLHEASIQKSVKELEDFLARLWKYSQSSNDFIAAIALYLLSNPYYSQDTEAGMVAANEMATRYPNLEATRNMLSLPIYYRKSRPDMAGEWIRAYQSKEKVPGKARDRQASATEKSLAAQDGFISKAEPLVDALSQWETKDFGVKGLTTLIEDPRENWRDRYSYIRMLEPEMKAPPGGAGAQGYWSRIKPTMEVLANQGELTPDVYRARVLLCDVAGQAGQFDEAAYWAERILTEQERVYEHPERILYEEAVKSYIEYSECLEDHKLFEEAAKAYERLADYYPNSALAIDARQLAADARGKVE